MASGGLVSKRKSDEFDVSNMEESRGAIVHGVITELSALSVSKQNLSVCFFDRKVTDNQQCIQVVVWTPPSEAYAGSGKQKV